MANSKEKGRPIKAPKAMSATKLGNAEGAGAPGHFGQMVSVGKAGRASYSKGGGC